MNKALGQRYDPKAPTTPQRHTVLTPSKMVDGSTCDSTVPPRATETTGTMQWLHPHTSYIIADNNLMQPRSAERQHRYTTALQHMSEDYSSSARQDPTQSFRQMILQQWTLCNHPLPPAACCAGFKVSTYCMQNASWLPQPAAATPAGC